jgi:chemotaxis protein methyltransferase CheR
MMNERQRQLERMEIELLLDGLARHHGYDFRRYAAGSLTRRIRHALHNEGAASISELQHRILHDPGALDRFLRVLTIHVTSMFRDADFYRAFRTQVVPQLRTYPFVRIWHAGCSTGEEAYSLAILLAEQGLLDRCRIYATDISDSVLDRARRGIIPLDQMRRHTEAYHTAGGTGDFSRYYVTDAENAILSAQLRKHILFSQHNLASDGSFNEFNVVLCRNVMIYFGVELRERVLQLLHDSLVRFGYLAIGKKESLAYSGLRHRFEALPGDARIYRRIA